MQSEITLVMQNPKRNASKLSRRLVRGGTWVQVEGDSLRFDEDLTHYLVQEESEFQGSVYDLLGFCHADDYEYVQETIVDALSMGCGFNTEHRIVLPDGSTRFVRHMAEYDDGALNGYVLDITDHRLDEEAQRGSKIALEQQISERTRQLQEALDEAREASRAKSKFLSSMSHELRTPMNSILGFTQLLQKDLPKNLTEGQKEHLGHILKSGRHLLNLINQVLDLAKIESTRLDLDLEEVDVSPVLEECLIQVMPKAEEVNVSVRKSSTAKATTRVIAESTRFRQVLLNLMSNAVKYNRKGGSVSVNVESVSGGDYIRISVSDTGPGIPEEKQPFIFDPFNRLGHESGTIEGTGIGLTITRELVYLMNGRIGFESKEGEGSVFWIELQTSHTEGIGSDEEKKSSDVDLYFERTVEQAIDNTTIEVLYVEDNLSNQQLFRALCTEREDISLTVIDNAEDGIRWARETTPDLIFLDLNMPGMSGWEALEILRADDRTVGIPVIALTADAQTKSIQKGIEVGFDAYITKPFDIDQVFQAVDQFGRT